MKKNLKVNVADLEDLKVFVKDNLLPLCKPKHIFLLSGDLGTGKTQTVKLIVEALGGAGTSSPTFSIINNYSAAGLDIYHIDLYRIKSQEDLESTGFWDIFNKNSLVFVEWPEKIDEWQIPKGWKEILINLKFGFKETERVVELNY